MAKLTKKRLVSELSLWIFQYISNNYSDNDVCLLLDEEDLTSSKRKKKLTYRGARLKGGVSKIDVIYDGSIVGKITIAEYHLYFIFAGQKEVELDFMPLYKEGKSTEEIFEFAKSVVRKTLAVDLEKSIGIMDFRAKPKKARAKTPYARAVERLKEDGYDRYKRIPRKSNPSTSMLGALIVGGIIGHSMKKK